MHRQPEHIDVETKSIGRHTVLENAVVIPELKSRSTKHVELIAIGSLVPGGSNIEEDPPSDATKPQEREIHTIDEGKAPLEIYKGGAVTRERIGWITAQVIHTTKGVDPRLVTVGPTDPCSESKLGSRRRRHVVAPVEFDVFGQRATVVGVIGVVQAPLPTDALVRAVSLPMGGVPGRTHADIR